MNKVYDQYEDLHVRNTYIYAKTDDPYAYSDSGKTVKIDADTLKNLFLKGIVISDGTVDYKPVSFEIIAGVGTITYVKTDATTATVAVLATLKSEEYVAG